MKRRTQFLNSQTIRISCHVGLYTSTMFDCAVADDVWLVRFMTSSTVSLFLITGGDWAVPDELDDDAVVVVPADAELLPFCSTPVVGEPSDRELLPASYEFPEQRLAVDWLWSCCSSELPDGADASKFTISGSESSRYRMRLSGDSAVVLCRANIQVVMTNNRCEKDVQHTCIHVPPCTTNKFLTVAALAVMSSVFSKWHRALLV